MKTQTSVDLKDLRFVCVTCQHCHTQLKLEMDAKLIGAGKRQAFMPDACPVCFTRFDSAITGGLAEFYGAYIRLTGIGETGISFEGEPQQKNQPG